MQDTTCIGVAKSEDYGRSWKLVWNDSRINGKQLPSANLKRDWLNDDSVPRGLRILFASALLQPIRAWCTQPILAAPLNLRMAEKPGYKKIVAFDGTEPFDWQIVRRENDGALFLIVSRRSEDGFVGNNWDGALYKSTDGAENWVKIALPEGTNGSTGLAIDRQHPDQLILSAWGKNTPGEFTPDIGGGSLYRPMKELPGQGRP